MANLYAWILNQQPFLYLYLRSIVQWFSFWYKLHTYTLTFRIIVHVYDDLFQRNFPLYTALFGTVWLLILGICHSIRNLFGPLFPWVHHFCMHYWENPLSKSFSKREICRYSLQEKKKLALPSWICKLPNESSWVIIDFWGCFHSILLFHSTVLCPCCSGSHSEVNGQTEHPLLRLECSWIECYCNFGLFLRVLYICHVLQMHVDQSNHYKDLWWTAQICLCWLMMVDVVIMKK